jgi:hypothetical protein
VVVQAYHVFVHVCMLSQIAMTCKVLRRVTTIHVRADSLIAPTEKSLIYEHAGEVSPFSPGGIVRRVRLCCVLCWPASCGQTGLPQQWRERACLCCSPMAPCQESTCGRRDRNHVNGEPFKSVLL